MSITTVSSRAFQQNASEAQKASRTGPVVITNRGRPTQVLLNYEAYQRLAGARRSIVEALAMPGLSDVDLEIPAMRTLPRPAEFS
ncbi:type II toxin-antitoxin system Phd/YefM family antitoxin [Bosea sp. (in: a-proteobacteria)]|uniref:type II toxin-antitoxin system Phd/YefM family antitoxin n=1 Tax=Bosea sp. (in: a-proteobacteria) TaxID=1871050 RepID=UPI0027326128|nr:type II toxin-antitoxin system Phd/YefM family antitoxin [Bosea sp. (in: a-proteobacteria)]MDP3258538.1 type II toxin-antitoxin system Phd/YefM family antitoxin [Bosea sp. (in: a-proteobacteria)]